MTGRETQLDRFVRIVVDHVTEQESNEPGSATVVDPVLAARLAEAVFLALSDLAQPRDLESPSPYQLELLRKVFGP